MARVATAIWARCGLNRVNLVLTPTATSPSPQRSVQSLKTRVNPWCWPLRRRLRSGSGLIEMVSVLWVSSSAELRGSSAMAVPEERYAREIGGSTYLGRAKMRVPPQEERREGLLWNGFFSCTSPVFFSGL
jgi:hypothetical protein